MLQVRKTPQRGKVEDRIIMLVQLYWQKPNKHLCILQNIDCSIRLYSEKVLS